MTKLLLTNDWHFAAKNPVSRTDDYNGELFDLLDKLLLLAVHTGCSGICVAGDLFHDKHPSSRLPWNVVFRLVQWCMRVRAAGLDLLVIPGNHDILQDNLTTLARMPLGLLFEAGLIENVSMRSWTSRTGVTVYGVPWPASSVPGAFDSVPKDVDVVLAHGFADPNGGTSYGEYVHQYDALATAAPHVRLWHFGHDHTDHGVYPLKNGAKVVNIGALCRGALDRDTLTRQVKTAIATIPDQGEVTVQQVVLPVRPVSEVFDLKAREQKVRESQQVEAFVAQLKTGLLGPSADYRAVFARMPMADAVRASVESYITKAEASVS